MNEKEIVRDMMKTFGFNQTDLAAKTGYKSAAAISEILNRRGMRVEILQKLVEAMDCTLVIRSDNHEWTIGGEKKELDLDSLLEE